MLAHVVYGAYLLSLQIHTGSFEINWWGEMVSGFSQGRCLVGLHSAQWDVGTLSTC
jgi:hypothetical protein